MSTAEDLYEMAKQLPATERLRLVEKLAHGLVPGSEAIAPAVSASGMPARVQLVGQVTDLAIEPPRFTVRTSRGAVAVHATPHLFDAVKEAWGKETVVEVDALLGPDGAIRDAVAVTIKPALDADDPLALFEATFGSGGELWSSPEGREQLETMRGGGS